MNVGIDRLIPLVADCIPQNPEAVDFQFDDISGLQETSQFQPTATADGAGSDEFARVEILVCGNMLYDTGKIVVHAGRIAARPFLSIHPGNHVETGAITDFVACDKPGPERIGGTEILAFCRPQSTGHFRDLVITGAEIIEDHKAEYMVKRIRTGDITAALADDRTQFKFIIQPCLAKRP